MLTKWEWVLSRLRRQIWFPVSLYGFLAIGTSLVSAFLGRYVPSDLSAKLGAGSVGTILNILASSMLAVTTFSLSIMLSAFAAAATGATPRATQLLKDDRTTQHVLASFLGGFLFSLVGIIGLQTGIYQQGGRVILFAATLLVIALIVSNLLRWIVHMTDYGRLSDTLARVEAAASNAMIARMENPYLGAMQLDASRSAQFELAGAEILAPRTGYIQMINTTELQNLAVKAKVQIAVHSLPGGLLHKGSVVARVTPSAAITQDLADDIRDCFEIDPLRSYEQDPRFGIIALSEIASRALSPAVNDPGTAIDVLSRHLRNLTQWRNTDTKPMFDQVFLPGLVLDDLMMDAFGPIARDGAGLIEVQIRLQKTLLALVQIDPATFATSAKSQSSRALHLAQAVIVLPADIEQLKDLHAKIIKAADLSQSRLSEPHQW
ncbi:MAG: DUF2254 domain-containing protein [Cypionkella sp.]